MAYIPLNLLQCVVFLGYKDQKGQYHFVGSAFWVCRSGPGDLASEYRPSYLSTASHVIEEVKKRSADSRVWVRANTKTGSQGWRETPLTCWVTHPDPAVDVAVLKIGIDPDFDHIAWPLENCVIHDQLDTFQTGDRKVELGDEVCFAGLFHPHAGKKRNIPIVRMGTVAALRHEPVVNRDGVLMDAYLVESRSIGGVSGSPVFIDIITAKRILPPSSGYMAAAYDPGSPLRFKLFGLVHGHFGDDVEPDATADDGRERTHINMGIAMVIPADKILEALEQFAKQEEMEVQDIRQKKLSSANPASLLVGVEGEERQSNTMFQTTTITSKPSSH